MPVVVDRTRAMTASVVRLSPLKPSAAHDAPTDVPRRKRKANKGKEVEEAEEEAWAWRSLTDSSVSRVPPVFTRDGSYFFSAVGAAVKIHSTATGEIVSTLTPPSNNVAGPTGENLPQDAVTAAVLNPHNQFQLITSSLDGCLRVWDFLDGSLLQTIATFRPIFHLAVHESFPGYVFIASALPSKRKNASGATTAEDNFVVQRVSLTASADTASSSVQTSSEAFTVGKTRATTGLATADTKAGFTKFVSPEKLTCLAFHPSEEYFATGDASGCIRLWYCLNESATIKTSGVGKTAQTTTLHWHAHAVSSLAFTANGAYLLSGGEEAVLVLWQLHSGRKEFVPRVGSPIVHVTLVSVGGEEEYLLGLADASFAFVRASTLKISRSISRIKLDPAVSYDRPSASSSVPLAVHSQSSTLILPSSHPSSLQTFSPSSSKLVSELEVSPSNRISRRDDKPLEPSRVERVILSDDGVWMATIDEREGDETFRSEVYLKIWQWDRKSGFWILNTRIDRPHGVKKVTGAAFRRGSWDSDGLLLATVGRDGDIKTWRVRSVKTKSDGLEEFWVARSTFRFRTETPSDIAWSPDGSLLAVCVGAHVAIYESETNTLCQVLTCPDCPSTTSVHFVGRSGRYLVVGGPRDIQLWDLVFQSLRWRYRSAAGLESVVSHPSEEQFIAVERMPPSTTSSTPSTRVLVFQTLSSNPVSIRTLPFRLRSITAVPGSGFFPTDPSGFTLVGITSAWGVVLFGDDAQLPDEEGGSAQAIVEDGGSNKRTLFHDIFGASAFADLASVPGPSKTTPAVQPWRGKEVEEIFNSPAHLMPPLKTLFDSVMDGFLTYRSTEEEEPEEREDGDEEGDEMDIDEEVAPASSVPLERVVDTQEMSGFVELFMYHAIKPSSTGYVPQQINGASKVNSVNGAHATPKAASKPVASRPNGFTPSRPVDSSADTDSTPAKAGKKRKKSLAENQDGDVT
ncbi:WD40 repeat-like protein [Epithele typhae]|uniref:WD40 repeat-like protein n=1 Tax=Epithele typhae TaxID=378194 RepID=UPI00200875BE|nr:WD40 repeat-like protein [Epithele typhae]KAH9944212.1 WD40 repeat-like protein [Epithele typhae]